MATLAPGSLLKFLLTGEDGLVLLQVIDILPADLDLKELWPKQGFRIKLSDGRHSTYVSLTDEQEELVLTAKLRVGQFIYVNKIVPGAPVPYIQGLRTTPGRHPLVGTPEDLANLMSEPNLAERKSNNLERSFNVSLPGRNEKSPTAPRLSHRRASVFPVANLKARSLPCTLIKSSTSSPDVPVNSTAVAHGNAIPKSLPGKLGTLRKRILEEEVCSKLLETASEIRKYHCRKLYRDVMQHLLQHGLRIRQHLQWRLSRKYRRSSIPKKNSNLNYRLSLQSLTRFSDQGNDKKSSNPADQQPAHAQDSKLKNTLYQMGRLAKQVKNETEYWFIEFIEKTLDTYFKNMNSFEDSRAKIVDSNRIRASVSRKMMLLTTLIDWVESQCSGINGEEHDGKTAKVLFMPRRLKLKTKKPCLCK